MGIAQLSLGACRGTSLRVLVGLWLFCAAMRVHAVHSISFSNNCGYGVPTLDLPPSNTIATGVGTNIYQNATILNFAAFLNTGYCGPNGGNCTTVDISLGLPDGSSTVVVDLIPTHVFSVPVAYSYYNACDGAGVSCLNAGCVNAIRQPTQNSGVVNCTASSDPNGVAGLLIQWCPNLPGSTAPPTAPPPASSHSHRGAIIGGVVGGVLGAALVLLFFIFIHRRRQAHKGRQRGSVGAVHPFPPLNPLLEIRAGSDFDASWSAASAKQGDKERGASESESASSPVTPSAAPPTVSPPASAREAPPSPPPLVAPPEPDLDRIVEGLASRFGWTAPPGAGQAEEEEERLPPYHAPGV